MSAIPSPQTHPAEPAAPSRMLPRVLRVLVIAALGLALTLLCILTALAYVPLLRNSLEPLVAETRFVPGTATVLTLLGALLLPFTALIICGRRGWLRWPQLTALAALVLTSGLYLRWDDATVRRPMTMDEFAPALPGDDATFQLVMRYAKGAGASSEVKSPKLLIGPASNDLFTQPGKGIAFIREHRAELESEWANIAPVRAWWDELAAQPRLGDLTDPSPSAPIIGFQPVRLYAQLAVLTAATQALDGHGDEAFATVTRLYSVARKLEPNSRTLVRVMIAKVVQKMALNAAAFVLDHAAVSPASRAALAAELSAAAGGPAGARRLVLIEYAYFQPAFLHYVYGGESLFGLKTTGPKLTQAFLRIFGKFVINERATNNLVGDRYYRLAALAETRQLGALEAGKGSIQRDFTGNYPVKNIGGNLLADMAMPAFSKIIKTYWEIDDLRHATLARLRA